MENIIKIDDAIYELAQATATLGFIQTAFSERHSCVNMEDASKAMYMLHWKRAEVLKR